MLKVLLSFLICFNCFAGYDNKTDGFYLKHFAQLPEIAGCSNFGDRVYRSGEPNLKSNQWIIKLKELGIEKVYDLRSEALKNPKEMIALSENNISYELIPLSVVTLPSKNTLEKLRNAVFHAQSLPGRILIHCQRGEDRTGIFIALMRDCKNWKKEFKNYGGTLYPSLRYILEKEE